MDKRIEGITHRQAARIIASHLTLFLNRRKQKNRPLASCWYVLLMAYLLAGIEVEAII